MNKRVYIFALFWLLLLVVQANAQTYYVRTGGNDSHNCTQAQTNNDANAKQTIAGGLGCISTSPGAGANKIVEVAAGTYNENIDEVYNTMPSGTAGNPFVLRGQSGATIQYTGELILRITSSYVTVEGFILDGTSLYGNCIVCLDGTYITLQNNNIRNMNGNGNAINISGDYNTVDSNIIHDGSFYDSTGHTYHYAMYLMERSALAAAQYNTISRNVFYNIPSYVIHLNDDANGRVQYNTIRGNYFYSYGLCSAGSVAGIDASAIMSWNAGNSVIYNNIFGCGTYAYDQNSGSSGNIFVNNTIYNQMGKPEYNYGGVVVKNDLIVKNNIFNSVTGTAIVNPIASTTNNFCDSVQTGCIQVGNPRLHNPAGGDFTLESNSLAINYGADVSAAIGCTSGSTCTDYAGNVRPYPTGGAWDIGAYEFGAGVPSPPTPALVLAMAFETGSGPTSNDLSGFNNNGTLGSGVDWAGPSQGKFGNALSFSGTGGVTIPNAASLNITTYTLEAWIYPTANPPVGSNGFAPIINKYDYPTGTGGYFLEYKSGSGYCGVANAALAGYLTSAVGNAIACDTIANIPLNSWTHIAGTYDGQLLAFYRDGQIISTSNPPLMDTFSGTAALQLGTSVFNEFFQGKIDEVRVYNYARTPAQIVSDMNTPLVAAPGAVAGITLSADKSITLCATCSFTVQAQ